MSTPPPDEVSDEDATMLRNLAKATNKYEAAIAIQPANNTNRNPTTSANRAGGRDQDEDEDGYDSNNIEDRDIDNLKKLRINR